MSESRAVSPVAVVANTIQADQMQKMIRQVLPKDVTADRFTRTTLTAIQNNPDLLVNTDRQSLYNAVVRCAEYGLMPDGKQAVIVKFWSRELNQFKAQAMPMVEGIIHIMGKAGVPAFAATVYENDEFEQWNDETGQHVRHKPVKLGKPRGARVGAFAAAKTKDGWSYVEAMDMTDLEVPKRVTRQKDKDGNLIGPWRDTPDRMEQKSALHRLAKRVPSLALRDDEEFNGDEQLVAPPSSGSPEPPPQNAAEGTQEPATPKRPRGLQKVVDSATDAEIVTGESTPQKQNDAPSPKPESTQGTATAAPAPTGSTAAAGAESTAGGSKPAAKKGAQTAAKPDPKAATTIQGGEVF